MKIIFNKNNLLFIQDGEWSYKIFSYQTLVSTISIGTVTRCWDGWSATTMRHINTCLDYLGLYKISKKDWLKMPIVNINKGAIK